MACPELDTICEAFLPGKTPRRFRQGGTEINADDPAGKTRSTSNRPGGDPGPAAHIRYCVRHVDVHDVEIFLQHLRENWMFGPRFKSLDDDWRRASSSCRPFQKGQRRSLNIESFVYFFNIIRNSLLNTLTSLPGHGGVHDRSRERPVGLAAILGERIRARTKMEDNSRSKIARSVVQSGPSSRRRSDPFAQYVARRNAVGPLMQSHSVPRKGN